MEKGIADERLQRLFALQAPIQRRLNEELLGNDLEVLVTGWGRRPGTQTGRSPCHRIVHFPLDEVRPPAALGALTRVRVTEALPHSLIAERAPTNPGVGAVSFST